MKVVFLVNRNLRMALSYILNRFTNDTKQVHLLAGYHSYSGSGWLDVGGQLELGKNRLLVI